MALLMDYLIKFSLSLVVSLSLLGCATGEYANLEKPAAAAPPSVRPVTTRPVEVIVTNRQTRSRLDSQDIWYSLDENSFSNLSTNLADTLRFLRQQEAVIDFYEKQNGSL